MLIDVQELFTYEDVARISRFKICTLRKWVQTGKMPFTKINGAIRFYPAEIVKWMAEKAKDFNPGEKKWPFFVPPIIQYYRRIYRGERYLVTGWTCPEPEDRKLSHKETH